MSGAQISQAPPFVRSNPTRQDTNILGLVRRNAFSSRLHGRLQTVCKRLEVKGRERTLVTGKLQTAERKRTLYSDPRVAQSDTIDVKQRDWKPVLRRPDDAKQRSVDAARL